jgi:hypothetical protein
LACGWLLAVPLFAGLLACLGWTDEWMLVAVVEGREGLGWDGRREFRGLEVGAVDRSGAVYIKSTQGYRMTKCLESYTFNARELNTMVTSRSEKPSIPR